MSIRRLIVAVGLSMALVALQSQAWADPAVIAGTAAGVRNHTSLEARRQHRAGVDAFAAARYPEAVSAFLTADALQPSAASSFNIAKAYEANGEDARALAFYREYLRRSPSAGDRPAVNQKIARLSKRVAERGVQQVTFLATPQGAAVLIDSEPIGATPITLEVRPGVHNVEFRKAGFVPTRFTFELSPDRPVDVVAKLATARTQKGTSSSRTEYAAGSEQPSSPQAAPARRGSVTRTLGFAALGASVAALGGAVTLEVMRGSAEKEARQQVDQVGFSEAYERMKSRQTMARVFAGAGGAFAAIGGVLLVVANGQNERPERSGVAFGCLPMKCHASYRGTF